MSDNEDQKKVCRQCECDHESDFNHAHLCSAKCANAYYAPKCIADRLDLLQDQVDELDENKGADVKEDWTADWKNALAELDSKLNKRFDDFKLLIDKQLIDMRDSLEKSLEQSRSKKTDDLLERFAALLPK